MAAGPWQVGVRFQNAGTAAAVARAFGPWLLPDDYPAPNTFGVRARAGIGSTLFHGTVPLARVADTEELQEALAWTLAGLAQARRGVDDVTDLRVFVGSGGAVLVAAARPELFSGRDLHQAGLRELPLLTVRLDADACVALPQPRVALSVRTQRWSGARVPLLGVVAKSAAGELADETLERIRGRFYGVAAREALDCVVAAGTFRTAGTRERLLRRVLALAGA